MRRASGRRAQGTTTTRFPARTASKASGSARVCRRVSGRKCLTSAVGVRREESEGQRRCSAPRMCIKATSMRSPRPEKPAN